ncbi:MAG TPA: glycosyltransferase [Pseudonocardia sp.]|nr:glycosyltransferase [Pseudonocardia sp.]
MRILLLTAGSRGDVDPFLALAHRARRAGHEVRVAVPADAVARAEASGVEVAKLDGDYAALVAAQGVSPLAAVRSYRSVVAPMMAAILRSAARAALEYGPDVLVHHPKVLSAPLAAARLGVPHVLAEIVPAVTPTREFPAAGVTTADLGRLNPLTYRAAGAAARMFAGPLREIRAVIGLADGAPVPGAARHLVPVSPALLPRPADWPDTTVLTGAWHEPGGGPGSGHGGDEPDPEVAGFLAGGDVLYAGFGSMAAGDPAARGRAVVGAARAAGLRVLVATGWGGIAVPPDVTGPDVLVRRAVPHATVLPRCAAAVHHGGAGTVHAVVRAGLPSVVVPFLADQPFWGGLLHRRGLAGPPVPARRLTAERLAAALAALPHAGAVRAVGERMAAEDGCGAALDVLTSLT